MTDTPACDGFDPDRWFPSNLNTTPHQRTMIKSTKAICTQCPVRQACAKAALDLDASHGIWAGVWLDQSRTSTTYKREQLAFIAGIGEPPKKRERTTKVVPSHCVTCNVPIVKAGAVPPEGHRYHSGLGMCNPCYQVARRAERKATA